MFIVDRDDWDDLLEEIRRACFAAFIDSYTTAENMDEALRLKNGEGDFKKFAKLAGLTYETFNSSTLMASRRWKRRAGNGAAARAQ